MNRTKIVATIGPATANADALKALAEAGMSVARLNGSHADLDWHAETLALIRRILPSMPILLDIPGRKIRTALLAVEPVFEAGDRIVLTTDQSHDGSQKVPVNYARLHEDLSVGDTVLADDGTLQFEVVNISGPDIVCEAVVSGQLKSRKGINVPHVSLQTKTVTDRDRAMVSFAKTQEVDFIGVSFVESGQHIAAVRELIDGSWPRIVAKIENAAGMKNLTEVVEAADVIMIDRGDLSVETSLEEMALFQQRILDAARKNATPVIVATEMLHTMIENPYPTKAEVSDISMAVLGGAAATMLSGETAIGAHPQEAVAVMQRITQVVETSVQQSLDDKFERLGQTVPEAIGDTIGRLCRTLPITKVIAITISGFAAKMISNQRPRQPIFAVSNDRMAARSFNLLPGVVGRYVNVEFSRTSTDHIVDCVKALWRDGDLGEDDFILVAAVGYPSTGVRMNHLQTHYVKDLVESLGWTH